MRARGADTTADRADAVVIQSARVRLEVFPLLGMTIGSLSADARDLLWSPPWLPRSPRPDDLGPAGEPSSPTLWPMLFGGWFEMSPRAGLTPGSDDYLHGEAVRRAWELEAVGPSAVRARLRLRTEPLELERRLEISGDLVTVTSTITNLGDTTRQIRPGEHPCFSRQAFAGAALEVRGESVGRDAVPTILPASADGSRGDARVRLSDPRVSLRGPSGFGITLHVDLDTHPYLGIWWNFANSRGTDPESWDTIVLEPLARPVGETVGLVPGETYRSRTVLEVHA